MNTRKYDATTRAAIKHEQRKPWFQEYRQGMLALHESAQAIIRTLKTELGSADARGLRLGAELAELKTERETLKARISTLEAVIA